MKISFALVGPIASGKGTISEYLIEKGFSHFQYGDEVRKEIRQRGLEIPNARESFQAMSDSLRLELGTTILAQRMAAGIQTLRDQGQAQNAIIDGLRHPDEVQWLKENFNTYVIGVIVPATTRFQRLVERGRPSDTLTLQGFEVAELRDRGINQPAHGNQGDACLALADTIIENIGTKNELEQKIQEILISKGIEGNTSNKERR